MNSIKYKDCLVKMLVVGNSGVGKTSLLYQYTDGRFEPHFKATIGIDFKDRHLTYKFKDSDQKHHIHLQIWDTAGHERFRSLTAAFYRDAMGFIVVFDVTNEKSFIDVRSWLEELKTHAYCENPDVILCGNKCDLTSKRVVSEERANAFADQLGLIYLETSAATGNNVEDAINRLLDIIMDKMRTSIEGSLQRKNTKNIKLEDNPKKTKKSCSC